MCITLIIMQVCYYPHDIMYSTSGHVYYSIMTIEMASRHEVSVSMCPDNRNGEGVSEGAMF